MSLVNYTSREITCKIVYYGAGRSGKTSNRQFIHAFVPAERRGAMVSLATETDRTLFFDYLPLELGLISGFRTRLQLYTVPGQVFYDATRRLVLRGADGVVFVVDSQRERFTDNLESFRSLHEHLLAEGVDPRTLPLVVQFNKRDLPGTMPLSELEDAFNYRDGPSFAAVAVQGEGVFETLRMVSGKVLEGLSQRVGSAGGVASGG